MEHFESSTLHWSVWSVTGSAEFQTSIALRLASLFWKHSFIFIAFLDMYLLQTLLFCDFLLFCPILMWPLLGPIHSAFGQNKLSAKNILKLQKWSNHWRKGSFLHILFTQIHLPKKKLGEKNEALMKCFISDVSAIFAQNQTLKLYWKDLLDLQRMISQISIPSDSWVAGSDEEVEQDMGQMHLRWSISALQRV